MPVAFWSEYLKSQTSLSVWAENWVPVPIALIADEFHGFSGFGRLLYQNNMLLIALRVNANPTPAPMLFSSAAFQLDGIGFVMALEKKRDMLEIHGVDFGRPLSASGGSLPVSSRDFNQR